MKLVRVYADNSVDIRDVKSVSNERVYYTTDTLDISYNAYLDAMDRIAQMPEILLDRNIKAGYIFIYKPGTVINVIPKEAILKATLHADKVVIEERDKKNIISLQEFEEKYIQIEKEV